MIYNIITNLTNGAGLQRDYLLMKRIIEQAGHTVVGSQFNALDPTYRRADRNIFLEVIAPGHLQFAAENWYVPNSEWYFPCWDSLLPRFKHVLCKTQDGHRIWQKKVGTRAIFTGWEANDFYRPEIERKRELLHLARNSENKGTEHIIATWREHAMPYPITIVARKPEVVKYCRGVRNVNLVEELSEDQLITKMNECIYHVAPTRYEGFGMWIHEAIGCGALVITTDAPPMNEFNGINPHMKVAVARSEARLAARFNHVDHMSLAATIHKAMRCEDDEIALAHADGRTAFLNDREAFRNTIKELVQ